VARVLPLIPEKTGCCLRLPVKYLPDTTATGTRGFLYAQQATGKWQNHSGSTKNHRATSGYLSILVMRLSDRLPFLPYQISSSALYLNYLTIIFIAAFFRLSMTIGPVFQDQMVQAFLSNCAEVAGWA
jgi:hypothetical protein